MDKSLMLTQIREHYKLFKNKQFADFFGLSEQNAYSWQSRGYLDLEVVYQRCPDISPEWLLSSGERGEMLREPAQQKAGNNNAQVGHDFVQPDTVSKALEALAEQQEITKKAQAQIDSLLEIVKITTTRDR